MSPFHTGLPADSLEFCPSVSANDIFVCGTYKLDDLKPSPDSQGIAPQHRRGQCLVFKVDNVDVDVEQVPFRKIQDFDLPAILDMKWCHSPNGIPPSLAIANSEGSVTLHQLQLSEANNEGRSNPQRYLTQIDRVACATPDVLCLSLDWSNRLSPQSTPDSLVVSLSNGSLCILRPTETSHLSMIETWHAHDHEPWVAAWNYWNTSIVYSGGDDLKLKTWDVRQGLTSPAHTNKRFDAGITSIQCHPHVEHLIAVGSYNNIVQLFDARRPLIPLSQVDVGGGAWRVKWHPSAHRKNDLLVASMYDGFKIARFDLDPASNVPSAPEGSVIRRFDAHTSIAYGADWSFAPSSRNTIIGSCSFYDQALYLWRG